jgi:hypothetical protein
MASRNEKAVVNAVRSATQKSNRALRLALSLTTLSRISHGTISPAANGGSCHASTRTASPPMNVAGCIHETYPMMATCTMIHPRTVVPAMKALRRAPNALSAPNARSSPRT